MGLQPRVAAGDVIRNFNETNKSPYIKRQQTIFHPGEVWLRADAVSWAQAQANLPVSSTKYTIRTPLRRSTRSGRCRATSPSS